MMPYAVGVDCGGTHTRVAVRLCDGSVVVEEGARGNVAERGPGPVARTILAAHRRLLVKVKELKGKPELVVVGAAGVGSPALRSALETCLTDGFNGSPVNVVTDSELALNTAFGSKAGMALVLGTGTALVMRTNQGNLERGGGWGPLAGDVGGGYWLGRHLLAHAADVLDGITLEDEVVRSFCLQESIKDRIDLAHWLRAASRKRSSVAALAPLVLSRLGDEEGWSSWLCSQAASHIGRLTGALRNRVSHRGKLCAVFVGGVIEGARAYRNIVAKRCKAEAGIEVLELPHPPVEGALLWAEESADIK